MEDQKKLTFRQRLANEKENMHPLDFAMSYILTPLYVLISLGLIATACILMELDEQKNLVPALSCFSGFMVLSIVFLAGVPFVRKKSLAADIQKYCFDTSDIPEKDCWSYMIDGTEVQFDCFGMRVDGKLFYYSHMQKRLVTGNAFKRIQLSLEFVTYDKNGHIVTLILTPEVIKMVQCLGIELENRERYLYLLSNKEEAFSQIFSTGSFELPLKYD